MINIVGTEIRIFADSNFPEIENAVLNMPQIPGVTYTSIINQPIPEIISYCDIVILRNNPNINIHELREIMRPGAKMVLCVKPTEEDKLQADDFAILDDIWIYPFSRDRAILRLDNLVGIILNMQEATLYKNWLEALMNIVPDMVWFKDLKGVHLKVNKSFSHAAGKTRKMIEGKTHTEIWGGETDDCAASEIEVLNSTEIRSFNEVLVIDNVPHHLKTHKSPFYGSDGTIVGTLGVAQDLTNLLNLNLEIGIFMEAMPFPLIMTGDNDKITHVNNKFLEMFNECKDDLIGTNYTSWHEWAFKDVTDLIGNILHFTHDEKDLLIKITETPLKNSFGDSIGMVLAFMDVTAEKDLETQIWKAANIDALTGFYNRHGFTNWLANKKDALAHLLYVDIDNFKYVNDTYGHKSGDEALCRLADTIREVFPEDFVVRLGGDEFLICVCRDMDISAFAELADTLQKKVTDYFHSMEEFKKISLSMGIRSSCDESTPIEQLIREADAAMYKAKNLGKCRAEIWIAEEKSDS